MIWRMFAHPVKAGGKNLAPTLALHLVHTLRGQAQAAPICETPGEMQEPSGKVHGYVLACTRCLAFSERVLERAR